MTDRHSAPNRRLSAWSWLVGLALAALVVVVAVLLASGDPDGLERVAADQGFSHAAEDAPFSIIPDYTVPGIDGDLSTIVAGLIGIVVVFGAVWLVGRALARRSREG